MEIDVLWGLSKTVGAPMSDSPEKMILLKSPTHTHQYFQRVLPTYRYRTSNNRGFLDANPNLLGSNIDITVLSRLSKTVGALVLDSPKYMLVFEKSDTHLSTFSESPTNTQIANIE